MATVQPVRLVPVVPAYKDVALTGVYEISKILTTPQSLVAPLPHRQVAGHADEPCPQASPRRRSALQAREQHVLRQVRRPRFVA